MQLENFLKLVKQDTTLQERLKEAPDEKAGVKLLKQLGSEKGRVIELLNLSEQELESVSGGPLMPRCYPVRIEGANTYVICR